MGDIEPKHIASDNVMKILEAEGVEFLLSSEGQVTQVKQKPSKENKFICKLS